MTIKESESPVAAIKNEKAPYPGAIPLAVSTSLIGTIPASIVQSGPDRPFPGEAAFDSTGRELLFPDLHHGLIALISDELL